MPRTARASVANTWYHVLNRGNRREAVFHKPADYDAFVTAMSDAQARLPVDVLGYCLMPNHFHLVIRTHADGDLGRWVQWLLMAHARRYHLHYRTTGHVWQGRFKAFPIEEEEHLVTVLRYVERNPLRAELVARAEDWKWSSLPAWQRGDGLLWRKIEVRDERWLERVNEPLSTGRPELVSVHFSGRGLPAAGPVPVRSEHDPAGRVGGSGGWGHVPGQRVQEGDEPGRVCSVECWPSRPCS